MKNIKKSIITAGFLLLITGCGTTSNVGYVWFGTGINDDWGTGGNIWSHFSSYSQQSVNQVATEYCSRKNLPPPTVTTISSPSFVVSEYYMFRFQCDKNAMPRTTVPQSIQQGKLSLNEAKNKCIDLGFKANTEELGKCVLQLSK